MDLFSVAGLSVRDVMRSSVIREELGVEPRFGNLTMMPPG